MVNGQAWPTVTVTRRPYWFTLLNAAQARSFHLFLNETSTGYSLNQKPGQFYVRGGPGWGKLKGTGRRKRRSGRGGRGMKWAS